MWLLRHVCLVLYRIVCVCVCLSFFINYLPVFCFGIDLTSFIWKLDNFSKIKWKKFQISFNLYWEYSSKDSFRLVRVDISFDHIWHDQVVDLTVADGKKLMFLFRARHNFSVINLATLYKAQMQLAIEYCPHIG